MSFRRSQGSIEQTEVEQQYLAERLELVNESIDARRGLGHRVQPDVSITVHAGNAEDNLIDVADLPRLWSVTPRRVQRPRRSSLFRFRVSSAPLHLPQTFSPLEE